MTQRYLKKLKKGKMKCYGREGSPLMDIDDESTPRTPDSNDTFRSQLNQKKHRILVGNLDDSDEGGVDR